jgi:competence protein ComFA
MKVVIYTIYDRSRWTWWVSLDTSLYTDRRYWVSKSRAICTPSMYRIAEQFPFGQALNIAKQMNDCAEAECERLSIDGTLHQTSNGIHIPSYAERFHLLSISLNQNDDAVEDEEGYRLIDHAVIWDKLSSTLKGRCLLWEEFVHLLEYMGITAAAQHWRSIAQWAYLSGYIELKASITITNKSGFWRRGKHIEVCCQRCGHSGELIRWSACASCGDDSCAYCESCLTMGRTRACAPLITGVMSHYSQVTHDVAPEPQDFQYPQDSNDCFSSSDPLELTAPIIALGDWQLSPAQLAASEAGIRHLLHRDRGRSGRPFLIWAVTGAGKTEMIFPLIATELQRRGKVLVATPRRDVVLELLPRIKAAFPHQHVIALYGGSTQRWEMGDITLATTHQLIRYDRAFDLVVIDEIDAYPYHNNPVLEYAAHKACSPTGSVVLLSATPPKHLQVEARKGKLAHAKVPVRFHGKPLPLPRIMRYAGVHKLNSVASRWLPRSDGNDKLAAIIAQSLERDAQLFIFVPAIHRLEPTLAWVRSRMDKLCNRAHIEATSSQDEHRHDKILRFRAATTRILLTTTILERGVTIPKADVIILDADSALFDSAALVQMAGRAGRSASDPFGRVYFLSREHTRAQTAAINEIHAMNRLAERRGYI